MAWNRGTQNNLPGEIRKGHIKEYLIPYAKDRTASVRLRIIDDVNLVHGGKHSALAYVSKKLPPELAPFIHNDIIYLHAHKHPKHVLTVKLFDNVPDGCILLNDAQRLNSRVCSGEMEDWTVYQGDTFAFDAREGAIEGRIVKMWGRPPPIAHRILFTIKLLLVDGQPLRESNFVGSFEEEVESDAKQAALILSHTLQDSIVSVDDIYTAELREVEVVCRVEEIFVEPDLNGDNNVTSVIPDIFHCFISPMTEIYVKQDAHAPKRLGKRQWKLTNVIPMPESPPLLNMVNVYTSDGEMFPVLRSILRPCIALTSVVQTGKGRYRDKNAFHHGPSTHEDGDNDVNTNYNSVEQSPDVVHISVDACTFDRVLLYLEHEARGEVFKFDPLIASELRGAAVTLEIAGLKEACDKVLGSFSERVRRVPIRLSEVIDRNNAGAGDSEAKSVVATKTDVHPPSPSSSSSIRRTTARSDTLLIIDGMVFDINRWLGEHPGGSSIIPEQALNVDATVFFEIYHSSKQSFLYLKEFYIGELAEEDRLLLPKPPRGGSGFASEAFLEQLARLTPWRLKPEDMTVIQKVRNL